MKPVIIIAITVVLFSITISSVMADQYDDAAAKCTTYECQLAIMNQKMNDAAAAGYDPMMESPMAQYDAKINTVTSLLNKGDAKYDAGELEDAIIYYNKVLEINVGGDYNRAAHLGLSLVYLEIKEWEQALENMRYIDDLENIDGYIELAEKELEKQNQPIKCGKGTIDKNGQCVPDTKSSKGGGCLIATATYGSELASQVQQLRELRDNKLLNTESGTSFMESFNDFYYSFSPIIADYERENPIFKGMVKIAITPMISSLSILNYVDMDSESEVLGYGIGLILLNIGMYFVAPMIIIWKIRK